MQKTTNTPTPQNISKWSLGRKEIITKNKSLKELLVSKDLVIEELQSVIKKLKTKEKLNGLDFLSDFSDSKDVQFDFTLIDEDRNYLTYSVRNDDLGYHNEIEIPLSEIIEHFDDEDINQRELDSFIRDYISDYSTF